MSDFPLIKLAKLKSMVLEPVAAPEFNQIKTKGLDNLRFRSALPMTRVSFNEEIVEGVDLAKEGGSPSTRGKTPNSRFQITPLAQSKPSKSFLLFQKSFIKLVRWWGTLKDPKKEL